MGTRGRKAMARPGPLSVLPEALFIDIDDYRNGRWVSPAVNIQQQVIDPMIEEIRKAGVKNAQKKDKRRNGDAMEKHRRVIFPLAANDRFPVFRGRHRLTRIWKELFRRISSAGPLPGYLTMTSTLRLRGSATSSSVFTKGIDSPWKETNRILDSTPWEIKKSLTESARLDESFRLCGYVPTRSV